MNKRRILIIVTALLLTLLCAKCMSRDGTQPSTDKPTSASGARKLTATETPASKDGSTTRPSADLNSEPLSKVASELAAGGRHWTLNFADQSLPSETRQRIGYDLNLIFGHLSRYEIDTLPFPLEVNGRQLDRRVRFEGRGRKWNDILQVAEFGCLFRGGSESELHVPKSVTDAYIKAIVMEKQNRAAYQQIDQFIARMSELSEKPIEDVRSLVVFADDNKGAEGGTSKVDPYEFAVVWGGKLYREPSILDIISTAGTPFEKYGSLVAITYAISSDRMDDLPLLVFSNGQWRFLLQRPPT